ncbi:GntR family transcriptional regulator [Psychromarinibacter sp. S121]|uniref:GntR family transcriptional regulator n=1 Tax=Psychromarinibacter sp. S121 TaxID=3415127 RepID=UPI003C7A4C17
MDESRAEILEDVRARICLAPVGRPYVIHEGELAAAHGVSRSPVRQVLQRLEIEGFVEVRVGVGTVATELVEPDRFAAFKVYQELAAAAANCSEGYSISDDVHVELGGLTGLIAYTRNRSAADYVRVFGHVGSAMSDLVRDPVLKHAMSIAHWRVMRWRTRDFIERPDETWNSLAVNVKAVADSLVSDDAAVVLRTAAGISGRFLSPQVVSTA